MMKRVSLFCVGVIIMYSCNLSPLEGRRLSHGRKDQLTQICFLHTPVCYFDAIMKKNGLVDLRSLDSSILVSLKYAGTDNFMSLNMYGCLTNAYLQPDVAQRFVNCQKYLKENYPTYTLLVYDAARPRQIQKIMWDSLHLPIEEKIKFLSNPWSGSLHNFGAAVDVTIADSTGKSIDMGTSFDHLGIEAYPCMEFFLLSNGTLTVEQVNNRKLLREVMKQGGFLEYSNRMVAF